VLVPDAAFLCNGSLPERLSKEGYLENVPELVVEVRSKNDTGPELAAKVGDYLKAGVKLAWTVDPATPSVTEHRPGAAAKEYGINDSLMCEDIIPGFRLALAELFRT
jgi:Uma2 family endonuclease